MSTTIALIILVSLAGGVALTFAVAYGLDEWRSIRYRRRQRADERARPKVPIQIKEFTVVLDDDDDWWWVVAKDRDGNRVCNEASSHPMDAIRYTIERAAEKARERQNHE